MLAKLDRRTREARLLAAKRAEFTAHIGGSPNAVQRTLIERAARMALFLEVMDREALEAGTMSERASRQYLALSNSLRLCLRELGVEEAAPAKRNVATLNDADRPWREGPDGRRRRPDEHG
jgi:hypothetical protein